ncbi:flagellar motor switch protein FliM [Shimia sp.]|uniref:flagellar motor switch protein FliM n=1 Tax=Shimia sp. TaxID=1954381 RepID=UPI0035660B71
MNKVLSPQELEEQDGNLIDEIIRMSEFSFDRLPMLDIVGERLADNVAVALPDLTRVVCEASLAQLDYLTVGKALESLPAAAIFALGSGKPLDGEFLVVIDATLLCAALELMLGGEAKQLPARDGGDFTAIERGFARRLSNLIAKEFERSLAAVVDAELQIDEIETDPDAVNFAQPASLCVRLKFTVAMMGHTGVLELLLPYHALEPIRARLGKVHFGERSDGSGLWHDQLSAQLARSQMKLEAVFAEVSVPIETILNWKRGDTLNLFVEEDHEATVTCAGLPMFRAALGKRSNGNVALQITEDLETKKEIENDRNNH